MDANSSFVLLDHDLATRVQSCKQFLQKALECHLKKSAVSTDRKGDRETHHKK